MSSEHDNHKAAYDDINVRTIALVGGVGSVLVFVAVVAVQVIYYRYSEAEYVSKVENAPTTAVNEVLAAQRSRISTAGAGAEQGEQSVPIEQAMQTVLAEYRQRQTEQNASEESVSETARGDSAAAVEAAPSE